MKMYSVAYLEHHADVFAAHLLHKHGLTLDQYLANPEIYARLLHADFPLLPAQTRVQQRLLRAELLQAQAEELALQLDGFLRNNVRPFQALRHIRHPKRRGIASCFRRSLNPQPTQPQTT